MARVNFGVSADAEVVRRFDSAIGGIPRSRAIVALIERFLQEHAARPLAGGGRGDA